MAGLLYDDYSLQYPGDFRVSDIALVSPYGNVVGITTNVTQINIYEDIYQNCLSGDIIMPISFPYNGLFSLIIYAIAHIFHI